MIINLETLNIYTFSLLAIPIALVAGKLKSATVFLVLLEVMFIAGSVAQFYPLWLPILMGFFILMTLLEERLSKGERSG